MNYEMITLKLPLVDIACRLSKCNLNVILNSIECVYWCELSALDLWSIFINATYSGCLLRF